MNDKLKQLLIPGIRLFAICAVAAIALGFIDGLTGPIISERKAFEEKIALASLIDAQETMSARFVAFPLQVDKDIFEEQILKRIQDSHRRKIINDAYALSSDGKFTLKTGLDESGMIALSQVLAVIDYRTKDPVRGYYIVKNGRDISGYILELYGIGYGGEMKMIAAYGMQGMIKKAKLLDDNETAGLGKKAEDEAYMVKFSGTAGMAVPVTKSMLPAKEADAISGASVTLMGISSALRRGSLYIINQQEKK